MYLSAKALELAALAFNALLPVRAHAPKSGLSRGDVERLHHARDLLLAGLQAIYESVAATGQLERFDFFVLSDTRREDIARAEEQMFAELRDRVPDGQTRLFYRRRGDNT
ncbi:hypothetical protein G6F24_018152 [Rhizopus arrhizus]|nr:hypothetical protein G6F24_018152 [Rhizopus arrhizus]